MNQAKKLRILISYFHEIETFSIAAASKKKALTLGGKGIGKGASLEEVMRLFETQLATEEALLKQENDIREAFPRCLLGEAEWTTHLGAVEKIPLPEGMLSILSGPCPIKPDKKVGETHMLVLIPETVNGQPLTLNSLGLLVKAKGHFPGAKAGYRHMDDDIVTEHGNKPAGNSHYVLMTKGVLPESRRKSYEAQQAMVTELASRSGAAYEVPFVLPAVAGILVNYLASGGTRLFSDNPWTLTRCRDTLSGYLVVGAFALAGLTVSDNVLGSDRDGVAAQRKF